MGFATSGAAAVLFVGLLIAVGIAYPAVETANDRRAAALDERDQRALDVQNTALAVANASYDGDGELTVEATNDGSTTLSVPGTDLLVDGEYRTGYGTVVAGAADRELWRPGERLTMTVPVTERPNRVKVVAENGVADTVTGV